MLNPTIRAGKPRITRIERIFLQRGFPPKDVLEKLGIERNSICEIRVIRGSSALNSGSYIGFRVQSRWWNRYGVAVWRQQPRAE